MQNTLWMVHTKLPKHALIITNIITFPMLQQKLEAKFELGNKTEQNVNLLSHRVKKQIHPQVNHHCVIASSFQVIVQSIEQSQLVT